MMEGWEVKKLNDVSNYFIGLTYSPKDVKKDGTGTIVLRSSNIQNGVLDFKDIVRVDKSIKPEKMVIDGDILMCSRNGSARLVGKTATIKDLNEEMTFGTFMTIIRSDINPYLSWFFKSHLFRDQLATGSNPMINQITKYMLDEVELPIPPLQEQKQIVKILDEAFAAIDQAKANIEKNIENVKELFQSRKQEIFQRLIDEIKTVPIQEVCDEIFAGGDAPKGNMSKEKNEKFDIPIIANAVKDHGLYGYTDKARVFKTSITVAARGSGTGHTEYRDYPFLPIVRLIVLTPNKEMIRAEFLMYAIKSLVIERSGSAIPQLTVPMMKSHSIPLPDLAEQDNIIDQLNELNEKTEEYIGICRNKLGNLAELKKSILQTAFSGELTNKTVEA